MAAQAGLAERAGCVSVGIPRHVSGGDPVHLCEQPHLGDACLQRHRHRPVVRDRLCLWTCCGIPSLGNWPRHGCSGGQPCRNHHGTGRIKRMRFFALIAVAIVLAGGNALAQTATNPPVSTTTNTTPTPTKEPDEKAWSFSL